MQDDQSTGADDHNPQANLGIQMIPDGTTAVNKEGKEVDIVRDYGNGRIRLNPLGSDMKYDESKDRGYYLHGKAAWYNRTHGCICDKTQAAFNYFWSGPGKDIKTDVPFSVNIPATIVK